MKYVEYPFRETRDTNNSRDWTLPPEKQKDTQSDHKETQEDEKHLQREAKLPAEYTVSAKNKIVI